ncbi:TPA: DinI-like family protein [Escherichia coli]|uniref:DinI-like family protein n=1 Tax=Escherichia coli TaxID=562 RepID=UPI00101DC067|nr:DinI-like family protein [Escherichia coli]EID8468633.1 DinI family protein [Escherichia coli]ELU2280745.1 DinI family protein [Escherichia coli]MBM2964685.1 DinI family protein [Escherichia coli]HCP4087491.1 DinI family protein [Escherichia coli]
MRINITLDKEQKLGQQIIDSFQNEITHRVQCVFPATKVNVKKGSMTSVEAIGFDKEADRETLGSILQEIWEDDSWR